MKSGPTLDLRAVDSWPRRCQKGHHRLGTWINGRFFQPDWIVGDPLLACRDCTYRRGRQAWRWRLANRPKPLPPPREPEADLVSEWIDEQLGAE